MAQTFRSAFNGFNRDDVAHYIEYITNKHNAELTELRAQITLMQSQLEAVAMVEPDSSAASGLAEENAALREQIARLEQQLSGAPAKQPTPGFQAEQELEAYRRAERTERIARERAENICRQASGVLADATAKVDNASAQIGGIMEQVRQQLDLLQYAVGSSRQALLDAAATMYAMNPTDSTEK